MTSGSRILDKLLYGVIKTGSITGIFREICTRKTQICHILAVTCKLLVSQSGGEGMSIDRSLAVAERSRLAKYEVLDKMAYVGAYNTYHQTQLLMQAVSILAESSLDV